MKTRSQALIEEAEHHEKMAKILRSRADIESHGTPDAVVQLVQGALERHRERLSGLRGDAHDAANVKYLRARSSIIAILRGDASKLSTGGWIKVHEFLGSTEEDENLVEQPPPPGRRVSQLLRDAGLLKE